jgi:ABC-type uncharacterized transport system permease subunit
MITTLLSTFGPVSGETAVFYVAGVIAFVFAAFTALTAGDEQGIPGRAVGFIALGLALWLFPLMWNTVDAAF